MSDPETLLTPVAGTPPPESSTPPATPPAAEPPPSSPPETPPPESYSFTNPQGLEKDDPLIAEVSSLAKAAGLSAAQAQKLLDAQFAADTKLSAKYDEEQKAAYASTVSQLKADKEFGGEKYDDSITKARSALTRFLTKEDIAQLNKEGLGNNPVLVRAFARIGRAIGEDSFATKATSASAAPKTNHERLVEMFK